MTVARHILYRKTLESKRDSISLMFVVMSFAIRVAKFEIYVTKGRKLQLRKQFGDENIYYN